MTDWLGGSAMLLSGLIIGFMILYGMKRRAETTDMDRKDLEAKRDALIAQLRLESDPEERARLETEAAGVLKRLDGIRGAPRPSAASAAEGGGAPRGGATRRATMMGFIWGATSVSALVAIGYFVMQSSTPKEQPAQAAAATSTSGLEEAVKRNPDDLNARNDLAKQYLDSGNMRAVAEQTQYVLQRAPTDARALTYEALVRIASGQGDVAFQMLQQAIKSDPNLLDAWVGLAWVNAQAGRTAEARAAIEEGKKRHPDQAQRLDELLTHLQSANPIRVTLNVAKSANVPANGIVFVIARAAGVTSGAPIAVKRVPVAAFPMDVDISSSDSMSGQQLPDKVMIDVRIDSDGDPMTRPATDLHASQDGVVAGQAISLTLR